MVLFFGRELSQNLKLNLGSEGCVILCFLVTGLSKTSSIDLRGGHGATFLSCRRTGPVQNSKIDFSCGDDAILSLFEGQSYRKSLKLISEVRMAPLLIFEEQDYRTFFRFCFRGESYLIP